MKKKMKHELALATAVGFALCANAPAYAQDQTTDTDSNEDSYASDPIIVTAQRRDQVLADVPQAVQAIGGEILQDMGVEQLQDVIALVPSATVGSTISVGSNTFQIRGVAASETDGDATVGFYLDNFAFSMPGRPYAPATDFYDLDRVEVLRGPSGTLYGLGSLGGTIKVLTNDPDLYDAELSTRIMANVTSGGEPGGGADAMFNVPISDGKLALRGVVSYKTIGGFADNIATGKEDANDANSFSARVKLRAEPTERLMIQLAAWHNRSNQDFSNRITSTEPPILNQTFGIANSRYTLLTGDVSYDLDFATLLSTTGYIENTVVVNNGGFIPGIGNFASFWPLETKNINQDLRLASNGNGPLSWIVGFFY